MPIIDNMKNTVYLLKNTQNNKIYIGQTWLLLSKRMGRDGKNYNNSPYLFAAINKYGAVNFQYTVLQECDDQAIADAYEAYYITLYRSQNPEIGYNIKEGGAAGRHSEETKNKISESIKNKEWSPEALEGRKTAGRLWKGKKRGPHTEEWKEQNSEMMKKRHAEQGHPMEGKHHTNEAKAKISIASKGKRLSEETKNKMSFSKRKKDIEEGIANDYKSGMTIKDIKSKYNCGNGKIYRTLKLYNIPLQPERHNTWESKTHSKETKEKMSSSAKKHWNNKNTT